MAGKKKSSSSSRLAQRKNDKAYAEGVVALTSLGLGAVAAAGAAVGAVTGNIPLGLSGAYLATRGAQGFKNLGEKSVSSHHTAEMIKRQGMNVAQSHRMAETLSMASLETGVTGPQSLGNPKKTKRRRPLKSASSKKSSSTKVSTAKSGSSSGKKSGNKKRGTQNLANRKAIAKSRAYRRK